MPESTTLRTLLDHPGGRPRLRSVPLDRMSDPSLETRVTDGKHGERKRPPVLRHASLIQYSGEHLGRRYVLAAPKPLIGRAGHVDILIADESVSREHARCVVAARVVTVEDLGSSNGTYVNGERIDAPVVLGNGDMLQLGHVHLKFFAADSLENAFHDAIFRKASIDPGTQVFNRQYLMESLETAVAACRANGKPLSLIYFDLDHFKRVNDTHGHSCGDHVLREIATLARDCLRDSDVLGRIGGEEFVVVVPDADVRLAGALAERLRRAAEAHALEWEGKPLQQTVSLGVAQWCPAFKTPRDLLDDADRRLYQSKHEGRNRVTVATP